MARDPKKTAALLLIGGKPDREKSPAGEEDESYSAFDDAADELFEAVKNDDKEAFRGALKSAIEICGSSDEE